MKENIEELRAAKVEFLEDIAVYEHSGARIMATAVSVGVCMRSYIEHLELQLEQSSRAQRTTEGKCNSAAAPAAGQAGLAKPEDLRRAICSAVVNCGHVIDDERVTVMANPKQEGNALSQLVDRIAAIPTLAAPVAADTEQATGAPMEDSNARFAIDAAIMFGREGVNKPPSEDHWLYEYWMIGQQLAKLGETSGWDNITPLATPADAGADDQEWDRQAEQLTREMGLGGGKINMNATSVLDIFEDDDAADAGAETTDLYKVVNAHCNDLLDCAAVLDAYKHFKDSAAEIRIAVKELRDAVCLSTPGAQIEAWEYSFIHSSALGRGDEEIGPCLTYDKAQAYGTGCIKQKRVFVGQSPAPVTAEPVAQLSSNDLMRIVRANWGDMAAIEAAFNANLAAPADRDAIRDQALYSAAQAVMREALDCAYVHPCDYHDDDARARTLTTEMQELYRALKSMERAADATDEQPTDKALLDYLDAWVQESKDYGMKWFTFSFTNDAGTAREQIAADMEEPQCRAADAKGGGE